MTIFVVKFIATGFFGLPVLFLLISVMEAYVFTSMAVWEIINIIIINIIDMKNIKFHQPYVFKAKTLLSILHSLDIETSIHDNIITIEDKEFEIFTIPGENILFPNELLNHKCKYNIHSSLSMIAISLGWNEDIKGRAQDQNNDCLKKFIYTRNINHLPYYFIKVNNNIVNLSNVISISMILEKFPVTFNSWYKEDGKYICKKEPLFNAKEEILNSLCI